MRRSSSLAVARMNRAVELVGLGLSLGDDSSTRESGGLSRAAVGEPQSKHGRAAGRDGVEPVVQRGLGAHLERVDARLALDDVAVKSVLDVGIVASVVSIEDARAVGLVVGEEELASRGCVQGPAAQVIDDRDGRQGRDAGIVGDQARPVRAFAAAANRRPGGRGRPPGPGVAEPQLGKDVDRRGDRARD